MKNFVVGLGRYLIDIGAFLYLIALVIMTVNAMSLGFANGILILIGGLVFFVFIFYLLYLLMSINDNLQAIRQRVEKEK